MTRRGLVGLGLAIALAGDAAGAAAYRQGTTQPAQQQPAIGPTQTIEWQSGADPLARPAGERPPNIVVILADDLGWNDLGWLGGGVAGGTVPTPNIDSLARDGVHFANGYSANGTCAPSRAALMTGRYGTRFGFDESLLMRSGLYLPEDDPNVVNLKQEFDGIDRFLWRFARFEASFNDSTAFEPGGYLTDYYTDQAVQVIEANKDQPFLLYLAHWAVHTPLQALRADYEALSHIEEHRLRVYAAMVRSLDRSVGRVLEALRENGLEENTLVFFTSDNGAPAYIGLPSVNEPFRGWKISFFEGGIHVPYLLKWPARLSGGQTYEAPVHGFDIFSTAAAAAGVDLPGDRTIDGVDLVPYVLGEAEGAPHDRLFWRTGGYEVVLADGWKLQISEPPGKVWLFNLAEDPTEQHNLAEAEPERVAALKKLLAEHNEEQATPIWPWATRSPINIDKTLLDPDAPDDEYIYWYN